MDLSLSVHSSGFARQLLTGGGKEILAKNGHIYLTILRLYIISIDPFSLSFVFGTIGSAFRCHIMISKRTRISINTAFEFLILCVIYTHLCTGFGCMHFCKSSLLSFLKCGKKNANPMNPESSSKFSRGGTRHLQ